jgi:hypothetical protein
LRSIIVPYLEDRGITVYSRWINNKDTDERFDDLRADALRDLEDIDKSQAFIHFTGDYDGRPGKGKFFELGYAVRSGKIIILVGDNLKDCVFYALPHVRKANDIVEAIRFL